MQQYFTYLKDVATRFDFGPSLKQRGRMVIDIIADGMKTSARLGVVAACLAALVGIPLGAIAALRRNRLIDKIIMVLTTAFVSMPSFIMGSLLLVVFAIRLRVLPANGSTAEGLILPIITLALYPMAYITRLTRSSMLDMLGQDYIRTAKAKGVSSVKIIFGHALKNSLIPVIHNSLITLEKNPNYVDADKILMDKIEFYLSDDANNQRSNCKNGTWQLIDEVPTNEIAALKTEYPDEFKVEGQIGTYYVCWNVNEQILPEGSELEGVDAENAKAEIRNAISLIFDRNYIVEDIAQGGQVPASSFVAMGMTNPDGTQFYQTAGSSEDFDGYYNVSADALEDNFTQAIEVLKKYYDYDETTGQFTNFPTLTYLYNTSEGHKAIGEYLQSAMAGIGITMNLENQEWATFLNTRKNGDYSIARNGWLADYNDPICFLDMWTTASGNNDVQFGKGAHKAVAAYSLDLTDLGLDVKVENGTWAETSDVLIKAIKGCTDNEVRYELMHRAEDLLMSTGCICPLYFYTDLFMLNKDVDGFFSNPLGYKYFMYCTVK